jgi:flagellar motor switch/type III secretory pathway protein FliN
MNPQALPWLPACALASPRSAEPVVRCLEAWSGDWLAAECLEPQPRWEPHEKVSRNSRKFEQVASLNGFCLSISDSGKLALTCAMLGRTIPQRDIRTAQDRAVLDHLLESALDDLARRLQAALPAHPSHPVPALDPESGYFLTIGCGAIARALQFQVATPVMVQLARSWAGSPRPAPALEPRQTALDLQRLALSARIGTSRLTLSELENMAAGDVLALASPIADPLTACIDGRPVGDAALSLHPQDDCFMLQIERPASQW